MKWRLVSYFAIITLFSMTVGCAKPRNPDLVGKKTLLKSPDMRVNNPENYFGEEYTIINNRIRQRGASDSARPNPLIGLALSGGGIRSSAFQLGILSGLAQYNSSISAWGHPESSPGTQCSSIYRESLLSKIGYISAVSGGAWATAAVKSNKCPICLFKNLDRVVELQGQCGDLKGDEEAQCERAKAILNNSYEEIKSDIKKSNRITDSANLHVDYKANEVWRRLLIQKSIGHKNDVLLSTIETNSTLPFAIFNTTHDASIATNQKHNFPFEMTALGMGTIADCGSVEGYCPSSRDKTIGAFVKCEDSRRNCPFFLSHAAAMSGAVLPAKVMGVDLDLLEWNVPFGDATGYIEEERKYTSEHLPKIWNRRNYVLTDGGHSENLGALALIERGVDLMIVSDCGYDPDYSFEDYAALKHHAKALLGRNIVVHGKENDGDLLDNVSRKKYNSTHTVELLSSLVYNGTYGVGDSMTSGGDIIYIKLTHTSTDFLKYLFDDNRYQYVYSYLTLTNNTFPHSKTFAISYDKSLLYSYYLYGKYISEKILPAQIKEILKTKNSNL